MKTPRAEFTKLEYGKRLAACLSYLILHQRDAVALGIFDAAMKTYIPRTGNIGSVHNIMSSLAAFNPVGQTGIGAVLHEMAGVVKRRGLVILISDLFDDEQTILDGVQHIRFGGSEVIVFHTMDPYELEFPFEGMVEFEGLENTPKLMTRPNEIRKSYMKQVEGFCERIRLGLERQNCHYVLANTGHPLHEMLSGYLAFRQRTTTR